MSKIPSGRRCRSAMIIISKNSHHDDGDDNASNAVEFQFHRCSNMVSPHMLCMEKKKMNGKS